VEMKLALDLVNNGDILVLVSLEEDRVMDDMVDVVGLVDMADIEVGLGQAFEEDSVHMENYFKRLMALMRPNLQ